MTSSFECPVCFISNKDIIISTLPCNHHICLKCTIILNPSLCPLCRNDYSNAIENIKSFTKKVREDYKNVPRFTTRDFPPLG